MILRQFPPMGVYETLFEFADATSQYMGDPGTHPWAQGFPLTSQLPGGPEMPTMVGFAPADMQYPTATGNVGLRRAIAAYYRNHHGATITEDHVAVFAGGRPAILATLAFLLPDVTVAIEETEYTPYWDMLRLLGRAHRLIPSHAGNRFRPTLADYDGVDAGDERLFLVKSNPCNPTGVTTRGDELGALVERFTRPGRGALFDEAYEFFHNQPDSALAHIHDIDATDVFVVGAATKGLQVPGARVGWAVAAWPNIELLRNYSSIGMGGVSRVSQLVVTALLKQDRVAHARRAVAEFYSGQRARYGKALAELGFELFTGEGGFYHWARLPGEQTADAFNARLFRFKGAILPGPLCDMRRRRGSEDSLDRFVRFSFGPLPPTTFDGDVEILKRCV